MPDMRFKKGYALIMVIIFSIVILILSYGLYTAINHIMQDVTVRERGKMRGYYAGVSGLRYAALLLRNPDSYTYPYTVTGTELGGDFFADIEMNPERFSITISEITEGADAGKYDVTATYTYQLN